MHRHEMNFEPWHKYEQDLELHFLPRFLKKALKSLCYEFVTELRIEFAYSAEPVAFEKLHMLHFCEIKPGDVWATENFACAWFRLTGKLPAGIDQSELYLEFADGGEGLLVSANGSAIKGFTVGSLVFGILDDSIEKRYYPLEEFVDDEGRIEAYIDGASNTLLGEFPTGEARLEAAHVVRRNPRMLEIYRDFDTLLDYAHAVDYENPNKLPVIQGLRKIENLINYHDPDVYKKAKTITKKLFSLPGDEKVTATAVAHAHLDLAWLWPIRETKRKARRTFANLIYLAERYPEFKFVVSQPQQLAWMKNEDPVLYAKLKALAEQGQMEPIGGAWVENDTNLPGEESLARQMLYGQKFWQEEFGHYVRTSWLPDAFGYCAAYPQIAKLSGQDSFMTIKISWSNRTIFPYNTFRWKGIDGSEVVTHMPPEGNYNSLAGPKALLDAKRGIKKTDPQDRLMLVYGVGDGGGGPSENSVERCVRTQNVPYLPKIRFGTAQGYFDALQGENLVCYQGEMYLEKHRGTYTSQSNNKNFNREFEEKMLSLEALLACNASQKNKAHLDDLWKEALLYQFHDIIPGSSIKRVYDETDAAYKRMFSKLEELASELGATFQPGGSLLNPFGESVFKLEPMGERYLLYSGRNARITPVIYENGKRLNGIQSVETDDYIVTFHPDGYFESIRLRDGRVVVENANRLRVFIDLGDAWDFEDDYRDQPEQYMTLQSTSIRVFDELTEIRQEFVFRKSKVSQTILLHRHDPCIRITHDVDWQDSGYMLRAEFEPKVWSETVHSDIQFGYLDRPTTDDTLHEKAQFEICCQKWFDLSDENMGFGVLSHTKNGFMAKQHIISINLLRSTDYPCVQGDQKPTRYSYALYPHTGGFEPVKIDQLAQQFNAHPLYGAISVFAPVFDTEQIQITAFKPAYDGDGFILRAFERSGHAVTANLNLPAGFRLDCEVNLLEDKIAAAGCRLDFQPFQIRSLRLKKATM